MLYLFPLLLKFYFPILTSIHRILHPIQMKYFYTNQAIANKYNYGCILFWKHIANSKNLSPIADLLLVAHLFLISSSTFPFDYNYKYHRIVLKFEMPFLSLDFHLRQSMATNFQQISPNSI